MQTGSYADDAVSQAWCDGLRSSGGRRDKTLRELHALLLRAAHREVLRRRNWLRGASGQELDDIAHQAAGDALLAILENLETYRGASRFTTWAYRFVINHVSTKARRHVWSDHRVRLDDAGWDRLPDWLIPSPHQQSEQRAQLEVLRAAVDQNLTARQRDVFVAVALNELPIDAVALRLGTNRGAIYKTLFDARTKLRATLAASGYPVGD